MPTDAPAPPAAPTGRPRPLLLVGLGLVVGLYLLIQFWPAAAPPPPSAPRAQATTGQGGSNAAVKPEDLHVRLGELKAPRPGPGETERNPFVFKPRPPPPPPPTPPRDQQKVTPPPVVDSTPPVPPPPPPIPLKFMGTVEGPFGKMGAFTDCKRTFMAKDGDIVDGRYRVMKIGLESATLQYVDGRGQQTIRMSGEDCVKR